MPLYDTEMFGDIRRPIENDEPLFSLRVRQPVLDRIINRSSERMTEINDNVVSLVVTSPPYNCGKDYSAHHDQASLTEYLTFLDTVWKECYRILRIGGRLVINIAGIGRKPYIPLQAYITTHCIDLGFLMMGEVIWDKGTSVGSNIAVGSWASPHKPVLRDRHEYLLIFAKISHTLAKAADSDNPDITNAEFNTFTWSSWKFATASASRIGHPAPFPEELPYRCIRLLSYPNDLVVDPFCGSGTTCAVAKNARRHYIGYDIDASYCQMSTKRIASVGELYKWM